ncbi:uncharacterized protein CANTADRAFT_49891 [Suhomyces tanzawaensis NRRL Y-17324]|uniref:Uncharacterized protein n=1 Tax=Suhomyces tanzawaensis NRRL Y-17324 TaxID=984487 RepID=A0A1E4SJX7_9ASCO|nr:uncharacterized protein CANTADRAFT_49891 [Suhomyces tanzawaensis NRRL Y-17324]ODV79798.1 hypothetical protein CANTADRAFT_49891 [Suhomyces tanzawaensis NRRL Y-17324]
MNSHPILKRVPKFLRPFALRFIHAPISHVTAFLILHELTAIIPLIGVWYVLHKYHLSIPMDLPSWAIDKGTKVIDSSMARFDFTGWNVNEKFTFMMEGAYAFVIVKFLLPVRLMISLGLMPWFSKWVVVPFTRIFKRKPKAPKVEVKDSVKKVEKPRL